MSDPLDRWVHTMRAMTHGTAKQRTQMGSSLGARSTTRGRDGKARRTAARGVLISLVVHGAIAAAILGTAWGVAGVAGMGRNTAPVVFTADFFDPAPSLPQDPRARSVAAAETPPQTSVDEIPPDETSRDLAARLRELELSSTHNPELDALARRFGALSGKAGGKVDASGGANGGANEDLGALNASPASGARIGASFAGLVAGNATKVAYVIDASGSMIGSFPAMIDEVERSLMRLEPTQSFSVVCFRKDGALAFGGDAALRPASKAARVAAVRWLRETVVPAGRSSPLQALAMALATGANCVFLLSTTVTGPSSHELDRASMLALLDRINPRDGDGGPRRATIQCIQFLEPDPGQTLQAIAAEHFGDGGYRFIPRSATSLDAANTPNDGARR